MPDPFKNSEEIIDPQKINAVINDSYNELNALIVELQNQIAALEQRVYTLENP